MKEITLVKAARQHFEAAELLYLLSFPPEERRPWHTITHPADAAGPQLLIALDGDRQLGFVTIWHFGTFIYIEHLAVEPSLRGAGTGAAILRALTEKYSLPIALEVEPQADNNPMAARRIGFYERCGFSVLDFDYIQPPYSPELPEVALKLMATAGAPDAAEIARTLHSRVYKASF